MRYLQLFFALAFSGSAATVINESARQLPLVHDVDVVVVGGSTAGVAAAVAAAKAGAAVFLAAPRPYLGEDLCASYRLWLEPDETPVSELAEALYAHPLANRGMHFSYEADQPSADRHPDTTPPSRLSDGQWDTAYTQSVQYNADTTVICDFGKPRRFAEIHFMLYQAAKSFEVESIDVSISDDRTDWRPLGTVENTFLGKGSYVESSFTIKTALAGQARYVRCLFRKTDRAARMLLGEINFVPAEQETPDRPGLRMARPMQVKRSLDDALLAADIPFLYCSVTTDILVDAAGNPAGVVVADRAGRQAIRAKVVIDATDRASLTRLAGARFSPYPTGPQQFSRVVVGGPAHSGPGMESRQIKLQTPLGGRLPTQYGTGNWATKKNVLMKRTYPTVTEYRLAIGMPDSSFAAFAAAEQQARDLTFDPAQVDESEVLFQVPPDPVHGRAHGTGAWPGAARADLDWFRPAGVKGLYVLGGCADVSRAAAAALLRPLEMLALGSRIGTAAASDAKARPMPTGVHLAGTPSANAAPGDTGEFLYGLRPSQPTPEKIPAAARSLPVLGTYDVVVIGGGTSGAPAAIGAARQGARTLVVEALHGLGGVATTGMIGIYCAGYRKGFTAQTEEDIAKIGAESYIVGKMESWRREIRQAGGDIWFGVYGVGAATEGKRVTGAVVATPAGRGVVLAKVVIDGTGNADIAVAAGAQSLYMGGDYVAMQGAGLPQRELGATYLNTDWTFVDEGDMIDIWSAYVAAKRRYPGAYDLGQLIDTRERRRIVGDLILSPLDIVNQRTFPDTIALSNGGRLDSHGYTVHPYYTVNGWGGGITSTPYRCLLPKGLDGILVVGLGVSAHRDTIPSIRMEPCMQNLGYAAGVCAAQAAKRDVATRDVDIKAVQQHLVSAGCLTPDVIRQTDSFPLPDLVVSSAANTLARKDYSQLKVLMTQPELAVPLLRKAHEGLSTSPEGRIRCAHVLSLLGDSGGVPTLVAALEKTPEWDSKPIGHWHPSNTWQDSYIIALGYAGDRRAVPCILAKADKLGQGEGGSRSTHYRAVSWALERLGDRRAAPVLAELLKRMKLDEATVHSVKGKEALRRTRSGQTALTLARALYRLGDQDGLGKQVLKAYEQDLRGVYARHAHAVLAADHGGT